jgi:hypothetical protein
MLMKSSFDALFVDPAIQSFDRPTPSLPLGMKTITSFCGEPEEM